MDTEKIDILIVGAGLSGLAAAKILRSAGRKIRMVEAADEIGGRVRTDYFNGFQFDRGFQVLLTAYPEVSQLLDLRSLDLRSFHSGAVILHETGTSFLGDPLKDPASLWKTLLSSAGTLKDKLLILHLRRQLSRKSIGQLFSASEHESTLDYLARRGFSPKMIGRFFKPFFGGVFLENQLETPSVMFEFLFKMFGEGLAAVPARGMGMIPHQLAAILDRQDIVLGERVLSIEGGRVLTNKQTSYEASRILLATDENGLPAPYNRASPIGRSVTNVYFSSPPLTHLPPVIFLNSSRGCLVNNVAVLDRVSPYYAPGNMSLVSVSVLGQVNDPSLSHLATRVKEELQQWFPSAGDWQHLRTYHIPYALPASNLCRNDLELGQFRLSENIFRCGDYLLNGSINAALTSGRRAAEAILSCE